MIRFFIKQLLKVGVQINVLSSTVNYMFFLIIFFLVTFELRVYLPLKTL
jgi:hypothetical protein